MACEQKKTSPFFTSKQNKKKTQKMDVVTRLKKWPVLDGDDLVPTLTRAVRHSLEHEDSVRALHMLYDDKVLRVVIAPAVDLVMTAVERRLPPPEN